MEKWKFKEGLINFGLSVQLKHLDIKKRYDAMTLKNIVPLLSNKHTTFVIPFLYRSVRQRCWFTFQPSDS